MKAYTPAGYWERRYLQGRSSGAGSEGKQAAAKAEYVNKTIARLDVDSVIDWGVGDGTILGQLNLDLLDRYVGVDVSQTILDQVAGLYSGPGRSFIHTSKVCVDEGFRHADLALSMDVLFHFPDDNDYDAYLHSLFNSAGTWVLIYSTNYGPDQTARHVLRRRFTPDVAARYPAWELIEQPDQPHPAGFYLYQREGGRG